LACIISIWFDHIHQVVEPEACILSQTDSTSALGWLRKTNFAERPDEGVQLSTARKLASLILETNSNLYSQWFPGDQNYIADSLSRDFHIDDTSLANLLSLHFPEQVPFGLTILPVPPEIVSWLTCLLRSQQQKEPWSKEPTRSKFALGVASSSTLHQSESHQIHTSTNSPSRKKLKSSAPSLTQSERVDYVMEKLVNPSNQSPLDPPWIAYHRSSNWLIGQTQDWMEMADLHRFYNDSCKATNL